MKSKPGNGRRQERNFEIVVNHITINEDQLAASGLATERGGSEECSWMRSTQAPFTTNWAMTMYISL